MARKLVWIAASFAVLVASGCDFSIKQLGVGDSCRKDSECLSGLSCVNRLCVAPPRPGTPIMSDASINAEIQVPTLKPTPEAGVDASSEAGAADAAAGDGG